MNCVKVDVQHKISVPEDMEAPVIHGGNKRKPNSKIRRSLESSGLVRWQAES